VGEGNYFSALAHGKPGEEPRPIDADEMTPSRRGRFRDPMVIGYFSEARCNRRHKQPHEIGSRGKAGENTTTKVEH
jgi:hypothetical protein